MRDNNDKPLKTAMQLNTFLKTLASHPEQIDFSDTMAVIDSLYAFTPRAFRNGPLRNDAGQNNGSCKLFAFARHQGLDEPQTLACFGKYYREDVLQHPAADDHQNIRNFMQTGWAGIEFTEPPLTPLNP